MVMPSVSAVELYLLEDIWYRPNFTTVDLVKPGFPINGLI